MKVGPIDWIRVAGAAAVAVLGGLVLYGSYHFYFDKPVPIIQYIQPAQGGTVNVNQPAEKPKDRRFLTSLTFDGDRVGGSVGYLW